MGRGPLLWLLLAGRGTGDKPAAGAGTLTLALSEGAGHAGPDGHFAACHLLGAGRPIPIVTAR